MMKRDVQRTILHIDIDSFFTSAETVIRPELKNKELAIAKNNRMNSIVSALSYQAKFKGASVPMKLFEVRKYCPNIIVLNPNFNLYITLSNNIYNYLFKKYTNNIEIGSIDEWYLDVTDLLTKKYQSAIELAKEIQKNIFINFNLDVSIGISYNKFLAKMATELNKPKGITITTRDNLDENLKNLPISRYHGIGVKLQNKLKEFGIQTIGDLSKVNPNEYWIKKLFKNQAKNYIDQAKGITVNDKIDKNHNNLTTIGNITTFENGPTNNIEEIFNEIRIISQVIERRLNQRNKMTHLISLNIKYSKNNSLSFSNRLIVATNNWKTIYESAINLFNINWNEKEIIAIGVTVNNLISVYETQFTKNIFDFDNSKTLLNSKNNKIRTIINQVNKKIGNKVCYSLSEFVNDKTIGKNQSKYLNQK